jgi:hypothetical protein
MFLHAMLAVTIPGTMRAEGSGGERTVVEPVPEAVEAILNEVLCCPKVEPGIDCVNLLAQTSSNCPAPIAIVALLTFVDDALKANHREQAAAHGRTRNQAQDNHSKQASSISASRLLEELPVVRGGSHVCR